MRVLSQAEATTVERPENDTWRWPVVASEMTSNAYAVECRPGASANNGDPLQLAYAVNFLESLYRRGYAVVKLEEGHSA